MEQTVRIVADSGSDLPKELVEQFEIELVPLRVSFGPEQYLDGQLSPDEFWQKLAGPHRPRTSQPSVGRFLEVFERLVAQGKQVLCVTITKEHSGTFNAARLAAQRVGQMVKVFDSRSASLGTGLQALAAAQAARVGASVRDIHAMLKDMRDRTRVAAVLDTLDNLRLGGRADAFIAAADRMARALDIKLIINAVEGRIRPMGAVRTLRSGLKRLSGLFEQAQPLERLAVIHSRSLDKAQALAEKLAQRTGFPRDRIMVEEIGAALACHGGPGLVGVVSVSGRTRD